MPVLNVRHSPVRSWVEPGHEIRLRDGRRYQLVTETITGYEPSRIIAGGVDDVATVHVKRWKEVAR